MRPIHGVGGWEKLSTRGAISNKRRGKTPMWCDVWSAKWKMRNAEYDASFCPSPTVFLSLLILSARSPARHGTPLFFSSVGALPLSSASFSAPMVPPPQYSGCVGWGRILCSISCLNEKVSACVYITLVLFQIKIMKLFVSDILLVLFLCFFTHLY